MSFTRRVLFVSGLLAVSNAQTINIQPAEAVDFPALVDSNSPAYWSNGQLFLFNSLDMPIRSEAKDVSHFSRARAVFVQGTNRWRWIESAWADTDGTVYGWYHAEPLNVCPGLPLTAPQIGALVSTDGVNFHDLGIILRSGVKANCDTENIYFAGGLGDFSVIPDVSGSYFYFVFTNYGGSANVQGIATARMAFEDRADPVGHVFKFFGGQWQEPGLGGRVTPIFPARADWSSDSPDSFWGPAIHWNTSLQQYVMLMSHVGGDRNWGQEGVYATFNPDLANPMSWTTPNKLVDGGGWYPQVLGYGTGETDTIVGAKARFFMMGHSEWDVTFDPGGAAAQPKPAAVSHTRTSRQRHQ